MKYMFLIYLDEAKFAPMSQDERDGFVNAMLDYDEELRASGNYLISEALKFPSEAITVRTWDGSLSTTDGPFAETKEHLSGFHIVEARDLNEAVALAARMPLSRVGSIEVRPIDHLERIEK
ncbi:dehydrogenase [Devosia geojensis]|uniref:Dehydrogenase n=1 Tax=Devosia geojensis TaxID=443610 RepID=A0A0F5FS85_9HYPH|nr:YciI family protein [Devosia geojensis]KKB11688.1 dehydrogenase [Devosia geojensis]